MTEEIHVCPTCKGTGLVQESKPTPLLHEDGSLHQFMPKINGKSFRCGECGCNVFHKPDINDLDIYKCNSCKTQYRGS